jgi:hypothetical protein
MCPVCGIGMVPVRVMGYRAPHYRCPDSELVFYGDEEEFRACVYPESDVQS